MFAYKVITLKIRTVCNILRYWNTGYFWNLWFCVNGSWALVQGWILLWK